MKQLTPHVIAQNHFLHPLRFDLLYYWRMLTDLPGIDAPVPASNSRKGPF